MRNKNRKKQKIRFKSLSRTGPELTRMTIGNQLKEARQKKQVTLNEAYQQTRIHPNVLSALEEDRFDQILNAAYVRSFLKEYARYLGLDIKRILAEYDELRPQERLEAAAPPTAEKKSLFPAIDLTKIAKLVGIASASILAIFVLIFLIRAVVRTVSSIPQKRTTLPREIDVAKPATTVKKPQKAPQKDVPKRVTPRPQGKIPIPAEEKLKLTITATEDVWLQLKVDDKIIFQNVLKKDSSEQWDADNSFTIWTGKAAAMRLNLNGNDLGTLGMGVKKNIVVTREGIKK